MIALQVRLPTTLVKGFCSHLRWRECAEIRTRTLGSHTVLPAGADPRPLRGGDIMTEMPVTSGKGEPVEKALREMWRSGVRRLPVVGQRGELGSVLSLDDVLEVLAGELQSVVGSIRNERIIEWTVWP
jgi:CBS domain-containing protein